jgi:hypothetical protein
MPTRTRKTAAAAASTNGATDLDRVQINLDTWEDADKVKEPFAFTIAGRRVVMIDPRDLNWQVLRAIDRTGDQFMFFDHCFADEDKAFFMEQEVSGRKMNKLMEMYFGHYKIEMPEGNGSASST